ncbi:MAG: phage holin family protein [Steroidobacteraceae bacterium]
MFRRVHQVNTSLHFLRERLPYYVPLAKQDAYELRDEIVSATVGACVSAAAGLILTCFVSVAVIVSAWDSHYRILTAWMVCFVWGAVAIAGAYLARRAVTGRPPPFRHVSSALARDYAHLLTIVDEEE